MPSRPSDDPHLVGLRMLARRELFTAQVRDRLTRRGFEAPDIEAALQRLREGCALDDRRAARAFARQAVVVKGRGRDRTLRELQARGLSEVDARAAVADAYATVDERELAERALDRRCGTRPPDRAEFRRLYQALCRQGFDATLVVSLLRARGYDDV